MQPGEVADRFHMHWNGFRIMRVLIVAPPTTHLTELVDKLVEAAHFVNLEPDWENAALMFKKGRLDVVVTSTLSPPPVALIKEAATQHASWLFLLEAEHFPPTGEYPYIEVNAPFDAILWPSPHRSTIHAITQLAHEHGDPNAELTPSASHLTIDELTYDLAVHQVFVRGVEVPLSTLHKDILRILMLGFPQLIPRQVLKDRIGRGNISYPELMKEVISLNATLEIHANRPLIYRGEDGYSLIYRKTSENTAATKEYM